MGIHEWAYDSEISLDLRFKVPHLPTDKSLRDITAEVELGFDREMAYHETQRCLNCDVQTVFTGKLNLSPDRLNPSLTLGALLLSGLLSHSILLGVCITTHHLLKEQGGGLGNCQNMGLLALAADSLPLLDRERGQHRGLLVIRLGNKLLVREFLSQSELGP